jgi:hypothetical protein
MRLINYEERVVIMGLIQRSKLFKEDAAWVDLEELN